MAKQIIARRKGDEYQARKFWFHLLELRINDYVSSVCFESDTVSFVDDVVVNYNDPIIESTTGKSVRQDLYQCKYHITQGNSFTSENMMDPEFINSTKYSLLQRLYKAYLSLSKESNEFRLYIFSNWDIHPDDELSNHYSDELIRDTFYRGGNASSTGKVRSLFQQHLNISNEELRNFLDTVRFQLGKGLPDLTRDLEMQLQIANLKPIDKRKSSHIYDDLAWKLFEQGQNWFDKHTFEEICKRENLVLPVSTSNSEIAIRSFPQYVRRPDDALSDHLDLTDLFEGRFVNSSLYWNDEIPKQVIGFFNSIDHSNIARPIYLFFDCHLSIAFLAGNLQNSKSGIQMYPAHKNRMTGYEFWPEPNVVKSRSMWTVHSFGHIEDEVIVSVSITNPIEKHLLPYLESNSLKGLPRIHFEPLQGIGPKVIKNGDQAWNFGFNLSTILRSEIPVTCKTIHLFFSGPAALAFILGNTMQGITCFTQLYEHDFEGTKFPLRYYPSIQLPIPK